MYKLYFDNDSYTWENYTLLQETNIQNSCALVEGYFQQKIQDFLGVTNFYKHLQTFTYFYYKRLQIRTSNTVSIILIQTQTLNTYELTNFNADKLFQNNLYSQVISRQVPMLAFEKMERIQDSSYILIHILVSYILQNTLVLKLSI